MARKSHNPKVATIMHSRLLGQLNDAEAVAALIRAGESERAAREWLRTQDALLTNDCIELREGKGDVND